MTHPDREHSLQIQLATALRERDEAREEADKQRARRNLCQTDRNAYELQNEELRKALAAANARADREKWRADQTAAFLEEERHAVATLRMQAEKAESALAAARRECLELRRALIELSKIPPADPSHVFTLYAFELARAALATPAAAPDTSPATLEAWEKRLQREAEVNDPASTAGEEKA